MNLRDRLHQEPSIQTGALNDILFILLLFFLIVSTLANPNVVKVNNPKGKSDTKAKQNIVVSINDKNELFLNQQIIAEAALDTIISKEVNKLKTFTDTPSVVVNADTVSLTGSFFKVMTAAKKAGAKVVANIKQ